MKKVSFKCFDGTASINIVDNINEITDESFDEDDCYEPYFFSGFKDFETEKEEAVVTIIKNGENFGNDLCIRFYDCDTNEKEINRDHDRDRVFLENGNSYHLDVLNDYGKEFIERLSLKEQYRQKASMFFVFEYKDIIYLFRYC